MSTTTYNDYLKKFQTSDVDSCTHLLLDGGKLRIPPDVETDFLESYAECMSEGRKLYLVERRPEIFKMVMDVDVLDTFYWCEEQILLFCKIIQSVIGDFYDEDFNLIICTAPPKVVDETSVKTGIHLIWPRLFTDSEDALLIRNGCIQKLGEQSDLKPLKPWCDVIDEIIYIRNGYRLVGSDKLGKGRSPENREYRLYSVIDINGEKRDMYYKRLLGEPKILVLDCSMRNVLSVKNTFSKIPDWFKGQQKVTTRKKSSYSGSVLNSEEGLVLGRFINTKLPESYRHTKIRNIKKYPDGNYLIIPMSRYCMNIRRDHGSCGIYFIATKDGIYQKCLCPCENLKGRLNGYCRDYTSQCFEFDNLTKKILFDEPLEPKKKDRKDRKDPSKSTGKKSSNYKILSFKNQNKKSFIRNYSDFCDSILESL